MALPSRPAAEERRSARWLGLGLKVRFARGDARRLGRICKGVTPRTRVPPPRFGECSSRARVSRYGSPKVVELPGVNDSVPPAIIVVPV